MIDFAHRDHGLGRHVLLFARVPITPDCLAGASQSDCELRRNISELSILSVHTPITQCTNRQDAAAHVSLSFNQQCQRAWPANRPTSQGFISPRQSGRREIPDRSKRLPRNFLSCHGNQGKPSRKRDLTSALERCVLYEFPIPSVK